MTECRHSSTNGKAPRSKFRSRANPGTLQESRVGAHVPELPGYRAPRPRTRRAFPFLVCVSLISVSFSAPRLLKTLLRAAPCPRALFPPAATPPRRPCAPDPTAPARATSPSSSSPPTHHYLPQRLVAPPLNTTCPPPFPSRPLARRRARPRARVRVSSHPGRSASPRVGLVPVSELRFAPLRSLCTTAPPCLIPSFLPVAGRQWIGG